MPVLTYNPATRMAVMDSPIAPGETELSSCEDWPTPLALNELGRFFVKCFGDVPDSVRQAPYVIQTYPDNLLEITFRNSVGLTRIGPLPVVVRNRKIAEPQYQAMLDNVVAKVAGLIFGFAQSTGQNVQRGQSGKDVAYLEMCFLRMALLREKPDIDAIAGAILADPHRVFRRVRSVRRTEDVAEVNPEAWPEMATRPQALCRVAARHPLVATALGTSLHRASGRWLFPRELVVEEKQQSVDTPENRFVKHFLGVLMHKVRVFQEILGTAPGGALNQELALEMQDLERKLRRFAQAGLWRDVGQMRFFPASSQVLQRREGYRSLFRLHALLSLRTQCRFTLPDFARILETKDTPTLYEYWTFFVVKDVLDARLPQHSLHIVHSDDQCERSMSHELVLGYEGDLRLCFNRTFFAPGQSYSHPLRPDITIEQGGRRLIMDAKFKGTGSGFYGGEADDGTIQRWREEDIDKMHAYRDAISGVQGAFILYPGLETDLFDHPDQSFPGVGALALRPGEQASPNPEHATALAHVIDRFCALQEGASC
jgi:uncharacterized protein